VGAVTIFYPYDSVTEMTHTSLSFGWIHGPNYTSARRKRRLGPVRPVDVSVLIAFDYSPACFHTYSYTCLQFRRYSNRYRPWTGRHGNAWALSVPEHTGISQKFVHPNFGYGKSHGGSMGEMLIEFQPQHYPRDKM